MAAFGATDDMSLRGIHLKKAELRHEIQRQRLGNTNLPQTGF